MQADESIAMQGIVGEAQKGVDQSFGKLVAKSKSKAVQGQIPLPKCSVREELASASGGARRWGLYQRDNSGRS